MKKLSKDIAEKVQSTTLKKDIKAERPKTKQAQTSDKKGWDGMESYAYAVKDGADQVQDEKSHSGFLGRSDKLLNPKDFVDREMLHKRKK